METTATTTGYLPLVLSIAPIILLIWLMVKKNAVPSYIALPGTALIIYLLQLFYFKNDFMLLNANLGKYERAFTRFVCNLFCFKIQVFDKTRPTRLWNALDEPFAAFTARVRQPDFQISEVPYPPSEVIISWLELRG